MNGLEKRLNDAPPPPMGTALRTCDTCLAAYLDYRDGVDAHAVVFGHKPGIKEDA